MLEYLAPSFVYRILKDLWALRGGRKRRLDPEDVVGLRQKWKVEFEPRIYQRRREGLATDVIIRDMKRVDSYPNGGDKRKGISPWFKVGLMGTYHRGIQVGLMWGTLTNDRNTEGWRYTDHKSGEKGDIKVIEMGYIPFENIEAVDWEGDEYGGNPHIYCYFDARRKEPYERIAYCEKLEGNDFIYYKEIADYDEVRKLSKKREIEYFS